MGHKAQWKIGILIRPPVTLRPCLVSCGKKNSYLAVASRSPFVTAFMLHFSSPFNFATHEMEDPPESAPGTRHIAGLASKLWHSHDLAVTLYGCDPSRHLQESPGPPGPKSQKSLKKSLFGGLQKSPQKYPKKSETTPKSPSLGIVGLFRVFSGTFLQTPKKTLFETFLRFWGQRARRLL